MKILHVINHMKLGGAQSLLVSLTKEQIADGNEVQILQLVDTEDHTLIEQAEENGVIVRTASRGSWVYSPFKIIPLVRSLREFDIVHVHLFPSQYWVAISQQFSRVKTPLITTEHSTHNKRRGKKLWRKIDEWVYGKYCYVVPCSEKASSSFEEYFPNSGINCITIPNGIDVQKYSLATPYGKDSLLGVPSDSIIITMVARFVHPKRQDVVIKSLAYLPVNYHVVLVGGSEDKDEGLNKMKELSNEIGVVDRVHFLYARKDIPRILKTSDVIVASSEYEGLSLSSLEGMAAGALVASNVCGLKEVVEGSGLLFDYDSPYDLSQKISCLLSNNSFYKDVKRKCLEKAKQFDISVTERSYMSLYKMCLKMDM